VVDEPVFQVVLTTMTNNVADIESFSFPLSEADRFYQELEAQLISCKTLGNFVSQTLALYSEEGMCVAMSKCDDSIIVRLSPESIKTMLIIGETP